MENPEIWIGLIIVGFLIFGAKRMPDAARGLGRSLRIFKAETKGLMTDEVTAAPVAPVQQIAAPQAVVPQAVVPQAVVPQAVVPQAVVPQAVVPQATVPAPVETPVAVPVTGADQPDLQ